MAARKLTTDVIREVKKLYLQGESASNISKKVNLSIPSVRKALDSDPNKTLASRIQEDDVLEELINYENEENKRIHDIKANLFDLFEGAIEQASESKDKAEHVATFTNLLDRLDNISRLNRKSPTFIAEQHSTHKTMDVNRVLDQLKSDDDRKAFLLSQITPSNNEYSENTPTEAGQPVEAEAQGQGEPVAASS